MGAVAVAGGVPPPQAAIRIDTRRRMGKQARIDGFFVSILEIITAEK
jgi:protein involved in polysaccharide export with SLBB domain